uniref:saccharopine dehydrogenase-like oxidoreductase n=1 Tax=Styela clava TaxID=7725 RepID=UPI001939E6F0|nr:saccharopine dehydrogenase-like oxidoreductase [Styela clava]
MSKKFDFVIFGASGFTGKYVCKELLNQVGDMNGRIALAGRSKKKLEDVLCWLTEDSSLSFDIDKIGFIIANVDDSQSLLSMCKQSKIVLDCVGPYKFYGEAVVKACIDGGSDYVDITGEPEYIEMIMTKYHDAAVAKEVYIVSACGFDSIPSELGVIYAKRNFSGTLATVENYFSTRVGPKGLGLNFGTYASIVHISSNFDLLANLFARSSPPICGPELKQKNIHYDRRQETYAVPFLGADPMLVRKSQQFYSEKYNEIPLQFTMYLATSFARIIAIMLFGIILKIFTLTSWGTKLLLDHPKFFTAGVFSKEGPTEEQIAGSGFEFLMFCEGYKKQIDTDEFKAKNGSSDSLDAKMTVRISGPEIAYVLTPIAVVQSAIAIAEERSKLPSNGGVYSPGPAFRDTKIIKKLHERGIKFEVLD